VVLVCSADQPCSRLLKINNRKTPIKRIRIVGKKINGLNPPRLAKG